VRINGCRNTNSARGAVHHLIDQLRVDQLVEDRVDPQAAAQQVGIEPRTDDRRGIQHAFGRSVQAIDARGDGGLQSGRHTHVGNLVMAHVVAAVTVKHTAFGEVAHNLLGEEGVPGGPTGDLSGEVDHRGMRAQQLGGQRRGLRITQRRQSNRLSIRYPGQCTAIPGTVGDQHHRAGMRNHRDELGQHRLADIIDPMHVLDDIHGRSRTSQGRGVDQPRQPPPAGIRIDVGNGDAGVPDAEQVIEQDDVFGVCIGYLRPDPRPRRSMVEVVHPEYRAQQPRHHLERNPARMGLAESRKHLNAKPCRHHRQLTDNTALTDPRRSHHPDHTPAAAHRLIQDPRQGAHLPHAPNQPRLMPADPPALRRRQQTTREDRRVGAFDTHHLGLTEHDRVFDEPRGGLAQHYPTRRGHRLHPLGHPDLLTDRGVACAAGADVTGNHQTRIQPDPHLQGDPVTVFDLSGQPLGVLLNVQRRHTGPKSVILQRRRSPEHGHDPITGELIDRAAVALHHHRSGVDQLGHDLAQPLRTHRRGDVHRAHHIGEQHRHLLVLGQLVRQRSR
jgi:hypothetical protein